MYSSNEVEYKNHTNKLKEL
ncbi:hypothetical protein LINPERPRIM_LOCUS36893 [Linum perenne]